MPSTWREAAATVSGREKDHPQQIGRYINIFGFKIIDDSFHNSYIEEDRKTGIDAVEIER